MHVDSNEPCTFKFAIPGEMLTRMAMFFPTTLNRCCVMTYSNHNLTWLSFKIYSFNLYYADINFGHILELLSQGSDLWLD